MAASESDKDYVAQLSSNLSQATSCNTKAERVNFSAFERNFWTETTEVARKYIVSSAANANLIIVQLSDNVSDSDFTTYEFEKHYAGFVKELAAASPVATVVCIGPWWSHPGKDEAITRSCRAITGTAVSISDLRTDPDNRATSSSKNPGVAAHPSDAGMAAIATRIIDTLRTTKRIR